MQESIQFCNGCINYYNFTMFCNKITGFFLFDPVLICIDLISPCCEINDLEIYKNISLSSCFIVAYYGAINQWLNDISPCCVIFNSWIYKNILESYCLHYCIILCNCWMILRISSCWEINGSWMFSIILVLQWTY